jgi:hypothetical protein
MQSVLIRTPKIHLSVRLITKADRSLVDCLCECADNILRENVPLTKLQREKLKRNKAGLRALTTKSVSLKKKKAVFTNTRFRLLYVYYITGVLFQALRDHVTPSASDARVTRNGV